VNLPSERKKPTEGKKYFPSVLLLRNFLRDLRKIFKEGFAPPPLFFFLWMLPRCSPVESAQFDS